LLFLDAILCFAINPYLSRPGAFARHPSNTSSIPHLNMIEQKTTAREGAASVSRRRFLGYAGALAGAGLLAGSLASCQKEEDPWEGSVDLGSGDSGLLNLLFAIKQLQAAFYTQALITPFIGMSTVETRYLTDIRNHEIAQRELLRKVLAGAAIADITPLFTGLDFVKRTSVLDTAKRLEDIGVSAFNGVSILLGSDQLVELNAKMASVEARHSAAIRDLILMGSFADASMTEDNGLDLFRNPEGVLFLANAYIKERLNPTNLPKS
jgi:hypothetical protein